MSNETETPTTPDVPAKLRKEVRDAAGRRKILRNVHTLAQSEEGQETIVALLEYVDVLESELGATAQALADL